jgi:hypothetical protein
MIGRERQNPVGDDEHMTGELFAQSCASFAALGFGGLGCRVAARGAGDNFGSGLLWVAAGTRPAELIATGLDHKLLLGQNANDGTSVSLSVRQETAAAKLEERREELAVWFAGRRAAVLFGALGSAEAGVIMPPLCAILNELGLETFVLGREPFAFEGEAVAEMAAETAVKLRAAADFFALLPAEENQAAEVSSTAERPLKEAFAVGESALMMAVELMIALYAATTAAAGAERPVGVGRGTGAFSAALLRGWAAGRALPFFALARAKGPEAPETALRVALQTPRSKLVPPTELKAAETTAVFLGAGREPVAGEVQKLTMIAAAPLWLPPPDEAWEEDSAACLVLRLPPRHANIVSLSP